MVLIHHLRRDLGCDLSHVFLPDYLGLRAISSAGPRPGLELVYNEEDLLIFGLASGAVVFEDTLKVFEA